MLPDLIMLTHRRATRADLPRWLELLADDEERFKRVLEGAA